MNAKTLFFRVFVLLLLAGAALVAGAWVAQGKASPTPGGTPSVVAYQGEVQTGGTPYTGTGYFKFAIVNATNVTYWSNDSTSTGGSEPTTAVQLTVSDGLFSVLLGDTTLSGMTQPLTSDVFNQSIRYLRVWFSSDNATFNKLLPDTRIAAVPYALQAQDAVNADYLDGLHASDLETHYQHVIVVAKSGGDYTSLQTAIDSITDAADDTPYLVWVAPGLYSEEVTMKPYVHIQGAGQDVTIISSTASCGNTWPPTAATLTLASNTSLRDLTVGNSGTGDINVAILSPASMTNTLVTDVTVQAVGLGADNYAIYLDDSGEYVTLQEVTALAENGSGLNAGLINYLGAAVLRSGDYTSRGGTDAWGIYNSNTAEMEAENVTALGENGTNYNTGLYVFNNATAVLYGGDFTGRGGAQTGGVAIQLGATLTAYNVHALAENGSGEIGNYGMGSYNNSSATLSGGFFIARGGVHNYGLSNEKDTTMEAENVTALAEDGSSDNHGLWNANNAQLTVRNSSFTASGGTNAYGIYNGDTTTTLNAESITALGENGSGSNFGFWNDTGGTAMINSSKFIGFTNGLYLNGGTVNLGVSQLDGSATNVSGTLICFQVYDGSYSAFTCP
jgi:hypothetical protein